MREPSPEFQAGLYLYRICVDELIQDVARLLVAPLDPDVEDFAIEGLDVWGEETEFYLEGLGELSQSRLTSPDFRVDDKTNRDNSFWNTMRTALELYWPPKEGLVYLAGNFRLEEGESPRVFVDPSAPIMAMRIDRLDPVKGYLKHLYTSALTAGGDGRAASHH